MSSQHGPGDYHSGRSHVTLQAMRSHVRPGSSRCSSSQACSSYVLNGLAVDLPANAVVAPSGSGCSSSRSRSRSKPACGRWIRGSTGCCGMRQRSAFSSGSSVLCSARSSAPARRRRTPVRGAVRLPAHPMVLACARPDRGVAPGLVSHGRSAVLGALRRDAACQSPGQLYLAVVIATLVGRVAARRA